MMVLIKWWFRRSFNRAAHNVLVGRYIDRQQPRKGRFTQAEVDSFLEQTWTNIEDMLPNANLAQYQTLGNRQNAFLALATLAAFRAMKATGITSDYATELISDAGWKVYISWLPLLRFIARLLYRDPQKQMNFILRALMKYPFNEPGYQRKAWEEQDHFRTDWYRCVAFEYVKSHGDREDRIFFFNTWCLYDRAVAREMSPNGRYERSQTLSAGDEVCDMRWYGGV